MQFQVPQFIEVEDKVFGQLTLKQFLYLGGGVGIAIVFYFLIPFHFLAILLGLPFLGLSAALAFYRVNEKPLIFTLEAAFNYMVNNKLYIWKKTPNKVEKKETPEGERSALDPLLTPRLSDSKLKDLAWSLDVNERLAASKKAGVENTYQEKDDVEFEKNYDMGAKSHT